MGVRNVGRDQEVVASSAQGGSHAVKDPRAAHELEPLRDAAEPRAGAAGENDAQGRGWIQIRRPRRSAATSSSCVRARSMMGAAMPSPRRSLMYRAQA